MSVVGRLVSRSSRTLVWPLRALSVSAISQPRSRWNSAAPLCLSSSSATAAASAAHRRAAAPSAAPSAPPLAAHQGLRFLFATPAAAQRAEVREEATEDPPEDEEGLDEGREVHKLELEGVEVTGAPRRKGRDWCAQLHVRGFDPNALQYACEFILHLADVRGVRTGSIIALPSHKRLFTVLKSPHVHKKSRDQYQFKTHKRLICLYDTAEADVDQFFEELGERNPISVQIRFKKQYAAAPPPPSL